MHNVWEMTRAERLGIVATYEALTPEQQAAPSLCAGWSVTDVVSHVAWVAEIDTRSLLSGALVERTVGVDALVDRMARRLSRAEGTAVGKRLERLAGKRRLIPGLKPTGVLADTVVHHSDIRRAVGSDGGSDPSHTRLALKVYTGANYLTGGKRRCAGLRLVATDLDVVIGDGPEVRGTGEALLMACVGRADGLNDLVGDGLDVLAGRL